MIVVNVILFFITIEKAFCVGGLKYYETLSTIHVSKRIRRNANKEQIINNLSFKMFDRDFDLTLTAGTSVLAKDFRAQLVHGDGSVTPHQFDQSKLFSGHETGKPDVSVHACIDNTLWVITIFAVNETYAVEPAYYLLNASENPKNDTMIAYRSSDFIDDEPQCGAKDSSNILRQHSSAKYGFMDGSKNRTYSHPKHKRSLDNHHCHMMLVGDYDFYSKRCNKNHVACMTIMVHFLSVADSIFKTSTFEDDNTFTNIGLKIGMLLLLTSYSDDQSPDSFNRQGQKWDSETKLTAFGNAMSDRFRKSGMRFCLHALLTYHAFPNRILGLAWTGAMCSDVSNRVEETTSLTTGLDEKHGPVHNLKVNLVLAHEIGHNFGSSHDPATAECSRPSNQGGNFLMWAKSVSGEHPNNKLFSPCSRVAIGRQLMMATCLTSNDVNHGFCGNSIQDHGEECDAGADGALDLDECCSATCMLRDGAICSDAMSPCCKNCKMAEKDIVCSDEGDYSCIQKSFCNGMSLDCPEAAKGKDFTSCFEGGTCYNGSCVGFCELESINSNFSVVLKPCLCAVHDKTACTSCCFDATDPDKPGPCLSRSEEVHKDGHPCYYGFCENGECKSHVTSTVKRFYSYLTSIPTDKLDRFIKSNLVMAIILITLMLWIPFSCFVFLNDLRQRARRERLFMIFFAGSGETKKELKKKESSFLQLLYLKGQRPSADQSGTSEQEIT